MMFISGQSLMSFLTAVTPMAVTPTAIDQIVLFLPELS